MSISLACPCGRKGRLKTALAGRKVRCTGCGELLEVPSRDVEQEALDLLLADSPDDELAPTPTHRQEAAPAPAREPARPPAPAPRPKATYRLKPAPQRPTPGPRVVFEEGWFGSLNAGVIGGVLMILIAVVWFVAGFAAGRIIFYPPVLLVIGIGAIFKGLFNRD
jgi:hypothetical protein